MIDRPFVRARYTFGVLLLAVIKVVLVAYLGLLGWCLGKAFFLGYAAARRDGKGGGNAARGGVPRNSRDGVTGGAEGPRSLTGRFVITPVPPRPALPTSGPVPAVRRI